jgi:hypothetical protein
MDEATLSSWDTRPEHVRALANQHADRHARKEEYHPTFFLCFRLLRRLGIGFRSPLRYVVTFLLPFGLAVIPALVITVVAGQSASIPLLSWLIVSAALGASYSIGDPLAQAAADNIMSLHRALASEEEIHRLMAWDRRWFSIRTFSVVGVASALGLTAILYVLQRYVGGVPMLAGTLWISAYLCYALAEQSYLSFAMFMEAYRMSVCHYQLYGLSPIDSLALKRAVRGYNQVGAVFVLALTSVIFLFVLVLPASSNLIAPIVVSLLLVEYLVCALGFFAPRLFIGRIVRAAKEQGMEPLRGELNSLLAQLMQLTEEEYDGMKRLQETHDVIRDSSENLLPLGDVAKIVGALALSTLTIVATAFADAYITEWVKPLLP